MKKVTIIYRTIPQYRIEFYNQLKQYLYEKGIELQLIYGNSEFKGRNDSVDIPWATFVKNYSFTIFGVLFIWQPCLSKLKDSELVIVEQANKLLINYILILRSRFFNKKFAFWGHGQNLQAPKDGFFNKFKTSYINFSSWWFPYTEGVKDFLIQNGVDKNKICVVQNAIDTRTLRSQYLSFSEAEIDKLRDELGLEKEEKILMYCGALTEEKNLSFLLAIVPKLKSLLSTKFKLIILGNGPERKVVEDFSKQSECVIYLGPKFGLEKSKYFRLSDLFVLPGAMGLAVLDAFVYETPMVTIEYPYHGPEIEYIRNNENGFIAKNDVDDFVSKVIQLINDEKLAKKFKEQGLEDLKGLNIETMVSNFGEGVISCLRN